MSARHVLDCLPAAHLTSICRNATPSELSDRDEAYFYFVWNIERAHPKILRARVSIPVTYSDYVTSRPF